MTIDSAPRTEARWEWMARCIAPLIHDGLLDVPGERQNIDKAFAAAKALDAALPEAEAALPGPVSADVVGHLERIVVLLTPKSGAADQGGRRWGDVDEALHEAARALAAAREAGPPGPAEPAVLDMQQLIRSYLAAHPEPTNAPTRRTSEVPRADS